MDATNHEKKKKKRCERKDIKREGYKSEEVKEGGDTIRGPE